MPYTDFGRHVYLNDPCAEQGNNAAEETIVLAGSGIGFALVAAPVLLLIHEALVPVITVRCGAYPFRTTAFSSPSVSESTLLIEVVCNFGFQGALKQRSSSFSSNFSDHFIDCPDGLRFRPWWDSLDVGHTKLLPMILSLLEWYALFLVLSTDF